MRVALLTLSFVFSLKSFAREAILLTVFEPFNGRTVNRTMGLGSYLKNMDKARMMKFEIHVCLLPVEYDKAAATTLRCLKEMSIKPSYIISLGEGSRCNVDIESQSFNEDSSTLPDNTGVVRRAEVIKQEGPSIVPLDLPVDDLLESVSPGLKDLVKVDNKMDYVCNNTSYLLATSEELENYPYGFIHIPASDCSLKSKLSTYPILSQMINSLPLRN